MTREEELDWLCRLRSEIYVYMPKEWLIPMNNALDMAISDLSENKGDLIRRIEVESVLHNNLHALISTDQLDQLYKDINHLHTYSIPDSAGNKGHWGRRIVDNGFNADWVCSECGHREYTDFIHMNFCPNCGADMREPKGEKGTT